MPLSRTERGELCRLIRRMTAGERTELAELIGITPPVLSQWASPDNLPVTIDHFIEFVLASRPEIFVRWLIRHSELADTHRLVARDDISAPASRPQDINKNLLNAFESLSEFSGGVRAVLAGQDITGDGIFDDADRDAAREMLWRLKTTIAEIEAIMEDAS